MGHNLELYIIFQVQAPVADKNPWNEHCMLNLSFGKEVKHV